MGNASFWVVEGMMCLPLGLLVWASQHVLNSLHPSRRHLLLGSVLPRAIVLLVLLVATCLMATCLFLAAVMSAPNWQMRWSITTLWLAFGAGCVLAPTLVFAAAGLGHLPPLVRLRRSRAWGRTRRHR
jgi:hypothetical protein